jgi:hypothetical protein
MKGRRGDNVKVETAARMHRIGETTAAACLAHHLFRDQDVFSTPAFVNHQEEEE